MRQLQGLDASFVALEQRNAPMHIGSIMTYDPATAQDGFVRFKDILGFIEARLPFSKTMRQRLVQVPLSLDYPYWVEDPDFDLEYHVRHVALPQPGDWRQMCIQTARIFSRPLDLSRPPWEFTIIEGLDNVPGLPRGSYAMVTKIHHAAIDGKSGIDLMELLHTLTPDAATPEVEDDWRPEPVPSGVELLARAQLNALTNPFRQGKAFAQAVPGIARAIEGIASKSIDLDSAGAPPKTRFNRTITPNRVVEGRQFPLDDIKSLRVLSEGSKINDVFLAIVGGALRLYLESKDELPEDSLVAMAPISVRSSQEKGEMGNQVAAMLAPLGTQIADPRERLAFVHGRTVNSKALTEALGAREMSEISQASPALFMTLASKLNARLGLANFTNPVFNTIVTNVPGPPVPIYSVGAKLVGMQGLICLSDGMALGHVVQSYDGQASITFTACRKAMPDPEFYAECLQQSFAAMMAELTRPARAERKTKSRAKARGTKSTGKFKP